MEEEKQSQKVNLLTLKKLYNTSFPELYYKFLMKKRSQYMEQQN
ncbi:hypothetical protein TZ86_02097 [Streptococcus gordonii]|uniref:Uncharacterized protein n=1 Tax=Streptococcus gordonii TaxID=1302 RepID=A0AAW3H5C1_STRGN|nr:hypothetical protein TZ86_02097 [Streptococcus gordonii]